MAVNTKQNYRQGPIKGRTQTYNPKNFKYIKRDSISGQFIDVKSDGSPFKGVSIEKKIVELSREKKFYW